ncbi:hypothetical protein DFS33DRAFT_1354963 [Desarmillaria ectypa]|nr:hypothetical protein DFS33DRAFT_1354963 [Desarmillaria ectypa]
MNTLPPELTDLIVDKVISSPASLESYALYPIPSIVRPPSSSVMSQFYSLLTTFQASPYFFIFIRYLHIIFSYEKNPNLGGPRLTTNSSSSRKLLPTARRYRQQDYGTSIAPLPDGSPWTFPTSKCYISLTNQTASELHHRHLPHPRQHDARVKAGWDATDDSDEENGVSEATEPDVGPPLQFALQSLKKLSLQYLNQDHV